MHNKSHRLDLLLACCLVLIIYGTLYPLSDWRIPSAGVIQLLLKPQRYSLSDIVTNYIVYVPVGALLVSVLPGRSRLGRIAATMVLLGGLSLLLEIIQTLLPARVPSITDTILNTSGAATGAILAPSLIKLLVLSERLQEIRRSYLRDDAMARAATVALMLWLAAQWSPFVPYISPYAMWGALEPLRMALHGAAINPQLITQHTLELTALGILLNMVLRDPYTSAFWLAALLGLGLAGNASIVTQQIYPEHVLGMAVALILTCLLQGPMNRSRAVSGILLLGLGVLAGELWPPFSGNEHAFNWIPLKGQLLQPLLGVRDLLDDVWPYCALAAVITGARLHRPGILTYIVGALLVAGFTGLLEWAQQWQPHRYPDITDIIMAGTGWTIGYLAASSNRTASSITLASRPQRALPRVQPERKDSVSSYNVNETT